MGGDLDPKQLLGKGTRGPIRLAPRKEGPGKSLDSQFSGGFQQIWSNH